MSTTSEVEIRIRGEDDSESAFRKARNNEERLQAAAKAAGIELTVMGRKGEEAGKITAAGADNAHAGVRRLNAGIEELSRGIRVLHDEFERTGDVDFLRQAKRLTSARKELEGFRKELAGVKNDSKFDLFGFLGDLPSKLRGSLITIAVGAGAALTPALSGAIIAGVSGGVIAGGILAAAQSTQVQAAWRNLGKEAKDDFTDAAKPFEGELIKAADTFQHKLDQIIPAVRRDFALLAPLVGDLAENAGEFAVRLVPGIDAMAKHGDVLRAVADELPAIGDAISTAMEDISSGAAGGKEALLDVIHTVEGSIIVLGKFLEISERVYIADKALAHLFTGDFSGAVDRMAAAITTTKDATVTIGDQGTQALNAVRDSVVGVGQETALTADQFKVLSQAITVTSQTADTLAGAMTDKVLTATMNLDQATLGFAEAQTKLTESIATNGRQLDIHTAKGQANREAILAVVAANIKTYDTNIAAGMSAEDAAAAYDANTGSLIKQMQQAHFTSDQIHDLIGKYMAVPDQVNTDIAIKGLTAAIEGLDDVIRRANHLDGRVTTMTVEEVHRTVYSNSGSPPPSQYFRGNAHGGVVGAATGGARSNLTMVGEHGFELLDLPAGTTVHSNEDSRRMLGGGGAPAGGRQVLEVRPAPGFDSAIMRVFLEMIETALRTDPAFAGAIAAAGT